MNLTTPIKISIRNLLNAKIRSFLTILGVIIGVMAVIIIFAAGQSAQALIISQLQGQGSNLVIVLPGKSDDQGPPAAAFGAVVKSLDYEDLEVLRDPKRVPGVENGAGFTIGTLTVAKDDVKKAISVQGVTSSFQEMEDSRILKGRFFDKAEEQSLNKICVLGSQVSRDLFGLSDPVGEKIKIKNQKFEVIGVLESKKSSGIGTGDQDETIYLPLKTSQKLVFNVDYLNAIRLRVKDINQIPQIKNTVREILRERHDIDDPDKDDFSVRDLVSTIDLVKDVTNIIRYFLLAVGAISLLVGGVGIMNIMLIAVNQRVKEIGLRKAIGAKNSDIAIQFIVESMTVSVLGGFIGIILGILISFIIYLIVNALNYDWPFVISPLSILTAFGISAIVGIIFGTYPAKKAAKISPMEALRYE